MAIEMDSHIFDILLTYQGEEIIQIPGIVHFPSFFPLLTLLFSFPVLCLFFSLSFPFSLSPRVIFWEKTNTSKQTYYILSSSPSLSLLFFSFFPFSLSPPVNFRKKKRTHQSKHTTNEHPKRNERTINWRNHNRRQKSPPKKVSDVKRDREGASQDGASNSN